MQRPVGEVRVMWDRDHYLVLAGNRRIDEMLVSLMSRKLKKILTGKRKGSSLPGPGGCDGS